MKEKVKRLRISQRESKESIYWLEVLSKVEDTNKEINRLLTEAEEITKIISTIIWKHVK